MSNPSEIALLLADVDGTLVTHDKLLTARARAAVMAARAVGIAFAITSGRPPRGMQMLFEPLDIVTPIAGFNGGMIVDRDLAVIATCPLPPDVARAAASLLARRTLDVWIYAGNDWFVCNGAAPHVARESWTVKFDPIVIPAIEDRLDDVVKIVGVTDDSDLMKSAEEDLRQALGDHAAIARSQPYYLDITHPEATKGGVLATLADMLKIAPHQIATIGDQRNDVLMFEPSGYSIAMGNAGEDVKRHASFSTDDSEHEGFAKALEHLIARKSARR